MKLSKLRNAAVLGVSVATLIAGQTGAYVSAAAATTKKSTVNNDSNTLRISPVRTDLTIQPGSSSKVQLFVTNLTSNTVALKPIENDFVAGDEKGTPSIILDENSYAPTHSLKRFMVPLQNVTLGPQATKEVDVSIAVPKSAQAGGYYGAVRFAPAGANGSQSVNLSTSVASLILMTVPGDLVEKASLTNFDVQQNGGTATNFRTPDNLELSLRIKNEGNVQVSPYGQIYVRKGKKVVYKANFNSTDPKDEILADSARRWTVPLKGLGKFGKYTIGGTFTYGTKGESFQVEKTIWIIPSTYIIAGVIGILALIVIIGGFVLFLKTYKKRIMRSSGRGKRRY